MESERLPRQLAAILYADVVGFSRMTEADEETTFLDVRAHLDHFAKTIEDYQGQVIKYAGDAVLAIFGSASDALVCAARVQEDMKERNVSLPDDRKICFRIGLNLGDVIQDRGDIFGDGVNIAARLEALAQSEGICISGSFYDAVAMKLPFDFDFMGEQQVKNISKPIRAYHVSLHKNADIPKPHKKKRKSARSRFLPAAVIAISIIAILMSWMFLTLPEKASAPDTVMHSDQVNSTQQKTIIILPFDDMSSNSDQGYFADGITEDIITDLSRLSGLQVMARNTSFRYKGQTVDPQQIASELKVSHMLEGSVRKSGDKLRITAQLIDTQSGHHVWADRYDRNLVDVFVVQDDVTQNIVNALTVHLTDRDKAALAHNDTNNIEAYEFFLKGRQLYGQRDKQANIQAQDAYRQAIKLDPSYARPYGALAVAISQSVNAGWVNSPVAARDRALELAKKAVLLNNLSQHAYWALAFTHLFRKEHLEATKAAKQATRISPNYADGYALLAFIYNHQGKAKEAIKLITKAMSLNPHYTWDYPWNLGWGHYILGEYEKAIEHLQIALNRNENARNARQVITASYMGLGMQDEAEWEIEQLLVQFPDESLSFISRESAITNKQLLKRFIDHLRKAGLPE